MKQTFPITGMHCAGCAHNVEMALKNASGVEDAMVNLADNTACVSYDDSVTTPEKLAGAVKASGYGMIIPEEGENDTDAEAEEAGHRYIHKLSQRTFIAWAAAIPLFLISMLSGYSEKTSAAMAAVSLPVLLYCGSTFIITAWRQLRLGQVSMDTLVAMSITIDYLFSLCGTFFPDYWAKSGHIPFYFDASVMIVAFVLLGRLLEERAKYKTGTAVRSLMKLTPQKAVRVRSDGRDEEINVKDIRKGDIIRVRAGENVAADGIVTGGETYIDESMMSGEPVPVAKQEGDRVTAGTVNQNGSVTVKVEKVGKDTFLAHIIKTVKEAQGTKVPAQRIADRIIAVFVPAVICISLLTFIIWFITGGIGALTHAVNAAVSVLVIACPCSLGLATPTAVMVAIGRGARISILFRDASALESLCKVNEIVFDKTGTLTYGHPQVVYSGGNRCTDEDRDVLVSAEAKSTHPLSKALTAHLLSRGSYHDTEIKDFRNIIGEGTSFSYKGNEYWAGNAKLMKKYCNADPGSDKVLSDYIAAGATVVYFGREDTLLSYYAISDEIKPDAAGTVAALQASGCRVTVLSGDTETSAGYVGRLTGVDRVVASASPDIKLNYISSLQKEGCTVAMVGDGINDSEALACADISIAIGEGSNVAVNSAQVILMGKRIMSIYRAFNLSRVTVSVIRRNLFWAFIYNVISIPIAAGVLYPVFHVMLSPVIGAAAMAMSSVSVVLNSLTLYAKKI